MNVSVSHSFALQGSGPFTLRLDVINLLEKVYQARSGASVGGPRPPQYGTRRGVFGGLQWRF